MCRAAIIRARTLLGNHPFGVPASNLALAGRVVSAPVVGFTQGHELEPKKSGAEVRYSEFGITAGVVLSSHLCELVSQSQFPSRIMCPGNDALTSCESVCHVPLLSDSPQPGAQMFGPAVR